MREQDPRGLAIVALDRDLERLAQLPQLCGRERLGHRRARAHRGMQRRDRAMLHPRPRREARLARDHQLGIGELEVACRAGRRARMMPADAPDRVGFVAPVRAKQILRALALLLEVHVTTFRDSGVRLPDGRGPRGCLSSNDETGAALSADRMHSRGAQRS
ncbi:MAG TPA: hypothetical protein VHT91_05585 [Kofleriaceae bacterium]|nr:hypothetical protein [Kofleriaceae bacterium]